MTKTYQTILVFLIISRFVELIIYLLTSSSTTMPTIDIVNNKTIEPIIQNEIKLDYDDCIILIKYKKINFMYSNLYFGSLFYTTNNNDDNDDSEIKNVQKTLDSKISTLIPVSLLCISIFLIIQHFS